ncbi:hypothetical protein HYW44_05405 [Candidatus Daviesbacteria bacterium]|nr:hypothetical protein [Candidatus Daviesbacteria bacterium]
MKLAIFFVFAAVILRLLPHMPNFTPVTAIALFGGAYLSRRLAIILPLLIIIISDYLMLYIGPFGTGFNKFHGLGEMFYSTILFVWGCFVISSLIGIWIGKKKTVGRVTFGAILASLQFFIITNFGVWLVDNFYPHNLDGLIQSYVMGIPFYRGTFLGDLFYTGLIFGGYELIIYYSKKLQLTQKI